MSADFDGYVQKRIEMFDRIHAREQARISSMARVPISIKVEGGVHEGVSYETTPFKVSAAVNKNHQSLLVCKVDGVLYDVHRVLEASCSVEFLDFASDEGKRVFWHSSAHVLGEACESTYRCHLCLGPPTDAGFFYEMQMEDTVSQSNYAPLKAAMNAITKEGQRFLRLEMTRAELLEMFADNPLKLELISRNMATEKSTVYRCGPLIDFCVGPHIPHTGYIKAIDVVNHGSCFFLGDSSRPVLQRIYGISFPTKAQMREHVARVEEAKKHNHRKVGTELGLFFFSPMSPGSCFFLPKGAFIYRQLMEMMREKYRVRGFKEVITPNIFTNELWKRSGHWDNYRDDMFCFAAHEEELALKPMNCPGHCIVFKNSDRSYKELPLRLADFGVLHRNELSGALSGLTRVRRFQQDDAHIFTPKEKIREEIQMSLDFLSEVYKGLGFDFSVVLSTRPANFIGEAADWDRAEAQLRESLDASGVPWELSEGDGAFYGPKIDVSLQDAMGRKHQCGTIQLDFQLPVRFDLRFRTADGQMERPVMIHRAILGSMERMLGILLEHFKGRLPPWLNPSQIAVIPVSAGQGEYAEAVGREYGGMEVFVDLSSSTLDKKILQAEKTRFSFIAIVGPKDERAGTVNIRKCGGGRNVVCDYRAAGLFFRKTISQRTLDPLEFAEMLDAKPASSLGTGVCLQRLFSLDHIAGLISSRLALLKKTVFARISDVFRRLRGAGPAAEAG